ncbi:putative RNA-directed DNA polymerase, eukaryota, reverse transcriptase zinc-binding domain protein [Tanacetum coccineum]
MEMLSLIVQDKVERSSDFQYHFGCKQMKITHVCFADDLLMFCHGDKGSVSTIKDAIEEFGEISGLLPNYSKSTIIFGSMSMDEQQEILDCVPFKVEKLPVKYLGVPLSSKRLSVNNCKCLIDASDSWGWKNILKVREEARKFMVMKIGNGEKTFVIFDNWSDVGILQNFITSMDIYNARRNENIVNIHLKSDKEDYLVWKTRMGSEKIFSVSQAYYDLNNSDEDVKWTKLVWFSQNIPKHSFVLWLSIQQKLYTQDKIRSWGSYDMMACPLCNHGMDSHQHLFFQCKFTEDLWNKVKIKMEISNDCRGWEDIVNTFSDMYCGNFINSIIRRLSLATCVYLIWQERNYRLFRNERRTNEDLFKSFIWNHQNEINVMSLIGMEYQLYRRTQKEGGINCNFVECLDPGLTTNRIPMIKVLLARIVSTYKVSCPGGMPVGDAYGSWSDLVSFCFGKCSHVNMSFTHPLVIPPIRASMVDHRGCYMPYGANSSFFTLIPKVNNPTLITDFRPISLIGIHYKIIAKILANRLSKVIDKIVSKEQSTFIVGRQILDGPIILSEIIEWHKKRKKQLLIFKVDFEKAFDSISWNYLDHILDSLGFGLKWRSWIKTCLSSSRASILVNGSPTSEFSINRGLRQGDPLSPFLFILVMEGLHNAFADAVGNGLISDLENIIRVLHVFYLASGLKINIHKSNIYGIGVNEDEVYNMASNAGCIAGNIPFNYLGLPIGSNMKSIASWKMLIDRFRSRLSTWKASLLSIGGRLTLIKSVLGSLGIYYLSIFRAPESVLNDLERIRSNFFWGGNQDGKKMAWVKWPIILNSYDNGGLNIGSLKAFNLALLQKWRWRLFTSPNDLWVKVVKAFHGHEGGFDNNGCSFKGTWANIVGSSNFLHSKGIILNNSFRFNAGCGTRIRFWKDIWVGEAPLSIRLNLSLRGMDIPAISCSSCNANVESANHIFFECIIASDLWKLVCRWCEIPFVQALSFEAFKDWLSSWHAPKENKHRLFIIFTSVLWWLWRFRNSVTFNSHPLRKSDIFDYVCSTSFSWLNNKGNLILSWTDWLKSPLMTACLDNG